jgi:hypothetical protein
MRLQIRVLPVLCLATSALHGQARRPLITERIDTARLHRLAGNTRPEANAANDADAVRTDFALDHMLLLMRRSADAETAVEKQIADLHNPASPRASTNG